jgi:Ca2+-binding RTX toxin-like protein
VASAHTYNGNDGSNTAYGHDDHGDTLIMYGGADQAYGRGGGDTIKLGHGTDHGDGNAGNDHIVGGDGGERQILGSTGDDSLHGEGGSDLVHAGANNDGGVDGGDHGDCVTTRDGTGGEVAYGGQPGWLISGAHDVCVIDPNDGTNSCEIRIGGTHSCTG